MPVFTRMKNAALVLTVDGDYTSNELRRVGFSAFESRENASAMQVLLDLSGAAGIGDKTPHELRAAGAFFGAFRDRIGRLAIVASPEVLSMFDEGSDFAAEAGVTVRSCQSHAEAMEWLEGRTG